MENASFHKGKNIEEIFKIHEINIMYLPPYSPDLNSIEKKWSQVKSLYRKLTHNFEDKTKLIEHVLNISMQGWSGIVYTRPQSSW